MAIVGMVEFSLVPDWVLWLFLVGLCTLIIGINYVLTALFPLKNVTARARSRRCGVWHYWDFGSSTKLCFLPYGFGFDFRNCRCCHCCFQLVCCTQFSLRLILQCCQTLGIVDFVIGILTFWMEFFVGFDVLFTGISVIVSGLPYWARIVLARNSVLRISLYVHSGNRDSFVSLCFRFGDTAFCVRNCTTTGLGQQLLTRQFAAS